MAYSSNGGHSSKDDPEDFRFSSDITLEDIRASHRHFCKERNWGQYHQPRNVLLAMVGEVGELSEIFQWKGEVKKGLPEFTTAEKEHVGEELSDILIYLVDLATQCHIDLPAALFNKMQKNALKYPVNKSYGKSHKYPAYAADAPDDNISVSVMPNREREEGDGSE